MSKFGSKEDIVKSIESHFQRMQSGKLSMDALEELVEQARELYERMLVLRYKAYEEKVFGEAKEVLDQHESKAAQQETHWFHQDVEEETRAETVQEPAPQEEQASEPVFDFSLFDEPAAESPSGQSEVKTENEPAVNSWSAPENEEDPENKQEEEEEKTQFVTMDTDLPYDSEVAAEIHTSEASETIPEPVPSGDDIFKHILSKDDPSRMLGSKLHTLVGAFGFNEKFQCIQELFKGSTEDFNQAIDVLDNMQTMDEARQQLQFYVRLNNWDLDSEITAEFVRKVERRFR
ncbi:MAG: hypothetical protein K0R65_1120 [Crocinitomicaceae bacterium]|jgi:hypothetical protein|nr:hypothetical protein [Crocinitomicaceae bacterium]